MSADRDWALRMHFEMQRARWNRQVPAAPRMRRRVEQLVQRLHTCPPGLPDTALFPPNVVGNPWPRYRTHAAATVGNYWLSGHWWRDLWDAMRGAFLAEVAEATERTEPDWAERRRQVGM